MVNEGEYKEVEEKKKIEVEEKWVKREKKKEEIIYKIKKVIWKEDKRKEIDEGNEKGKIIKIDSEKRRIGIKMNKGEERF